MSLAKYVAESGIRRVAVYGAGLMGTGIAQVAAQAGFNVTLVDVSEPALQRATSRIQNAIAKISNRDKSNAAAGTAGVAPAPATIPITTTTDAAAAARTADLALECVVEDLSAKHFLLRTLQENAPKGAILATNTSSLAVADIASVLEAGRQKRFLGIHFFNPVPAMKLVEVVPTSQTDQDVSLKACAFAKALGKTPVTCRDAPGFIVNGLLVPYVMRAISMVATGHASAEDVDAGMRLGAGHPMGPLELADLVGIDTLALIARNWGATGDASCGKASALLDKFVAEGRLGRKTGRGFYDYPKK